MIHYDKILNMAVQIIEELWKEERKAVAYVIQNVYERSVSGEHWMLAWKLREPPK